MTVAESEKKIHMLRVINDSLNHSVTCPVEPTKKSILRLAAFLECTNNIHSV